MANVCDVSSFNSGFLTGFWASFFEAYIVTILAACFAYVLISYCIKSFGMYKMARNRNFDNSYLAWFPFARHYLFGKISDDINKNKNIQSSNGVVLLILSILNSISFFALCMFIFVSIGEIIGAASSFSSSSDYWIKFFQNKANIFLTIITIMFIIKILFNIFYCIYANNIFKDYIPKISALVCAIIVLNLFMFGDQLVDSVVFLSISTNQPESLKNSNQIVD